MRFTQRAIGPSAVREVAREAAKLDTFGGTVHVEWGADAAATPLGHLAFFAEFPKASGRFDALVADCPLYCMSPNAPSKRDIPGTLMLSVFVEQWRYAHITALRGDGVNPSLLGQTKVVASEDSVRRSLEQFGAEDGASWLQSHLDNTARPLLSELWVLDCDTTIKPLYGHQKGAVVSHNLKKPGRPSHAYHAFLLASTKMWELAVLATAQDLEVLSADQLYRYRADAENGFDDLSNQTNTTKGT